MAKFIVFWTLEKNYSIITQPCLKSTKPGDTTEGKFMGKIYPCIVIKKQSQRDEVMFKKFLQRILQEEHPDDINSHVINYVKSTCIDLQQNSNPTTTQQQVSSPSINSKTSSHAKELNSIWTSKPLKDVTRSPSTLKDVTRSPSKLKDVTRSPIKLKNVSRSPKTFEKKSTLTSKPLKNVTSSPSREDVTRSPSRKDVTSPKSMEKRVQNGETNHKKRSVDFVEIDSEEEEEEPQCKSCKRLKEHIACLGQQVESLKQNSEQLETRPLPGVVSSNVAKEFNMVEVYAGTGVYWYRSQRDFVYFNSNGPEALLSKALDVFFTKENLKKSSANGGGQYEALDQGIVKACICMVQKRWDIKTSQLTKTINDKCSNARRPPRLGCYSPEKYRLKKQKSGH